MFLERIEIRCCQQFSAHPRQHLKGDDDGYEDGHLDQLPAHPVLHLEHIEQGVDQVLVNLGIRNIIIVLQLIGNCTCHWPRGGACLVVSG